MTRRVAVIALMALVTHSAPTEAQQHSSFPIDPGLTWIYRGHIRWTGPDRRVHDDSITWTMKIVSVRTGPYARAALAQGWVQDLAWHEPSKKPTYCALIGRAGRLYHVAALDSASAVALLDSAVRAAALPPSVSDLVLDSALLVGAVYGRDSATGKRDDTMYGWYVASDRVIAAQAAWKAANTRVRRVTLEYRTQPDYQLIEFVPGVGITRFVYSHHGTVAETDVRLISMKR